MMQERAEMVCELRTMLRDLFAAKIKGATYTRIARAHGYIDGYMRALMGMGMATKEELLAVVASERQNVYGAALEGMSANPMAA